MILLQLLAQPDFQAAVDRPVIDALAHRIGKARLLERDAAFGIVVEEIER